MKIARSHYHDRSSNSLLEALRSSSTARMDSLVLAADLNPTSMNAFNVSVVEELERAGNATPIHLVNVGRGGLVQERALEIGLERNVVSTYSTDVWFTEPPNFSASSLLSRFGGRRIFLTPHIGGVVEETKNDEVCANGIFDFLVHSRIPSSSISSILDGNSHHSSSNKIDSLVENCLRRDPSVDLRTQFSRNPAETATKGRDESFLLPAHSPKAVFYPQTTEQVSNFIKGCNDLSLAVIPVGACTSLEGHIHAMNEETVSIDLSKFMKSVKEISIEDSFCVVEAGITRRKLNEELRGTGVSSVTRSSLISAAL